jgi:hypothetical protein
MVKPRTPTPTVTFVDRYYQHYQLLFPEVRSFEAFKQLHLGLFHTSSVRLCQQLQEC